MVRTLVYSNTGLSSWQIGVTTEVIESLFLEERELKIINCNSILSNCFFNIAGNPIGCALCQSRQNALLSLGKIPQESISSLQELTKNEKFDFPVFNTLDELIHFEYEGFNIGRGPASSIVSYTRDYHLNGEKYQDLIKEELTKSINVFRNFRKIIDEFVPEEIYLFNGRFSEVWPLVLLAEHEGVDYYCIEAGSPSKYEIFKNALPHSIQYRHKSIMNLWKISDIKNKSEIASSWFKDRRNRTNIGEIQFTIDQEVGQIPAHWNYEKINIVIFNSSEDELKALQEWQIDAYKNQNEAIEKIVRKYSSSPEVQFYLRVHPNLGKVGNSQIREIREMNFPNLQVIGPQESVDTYRLMEVANKVISFGSSTGIEATFWGACSILFGKSTYSYLDATYEVCNFDELFRLLNTENLPAKDRSRTYPFGYYIKTYGTDTIFFKGGGLTKATYKGKRVRILYFSFLMYLVKYLYKIPIWLRILRALGTPFGPSNIWRFK